MRMWEENKHRTENNPRAPRNTLDAVLVEFPELALRLRDLPPRGPAMMGHARVGSVLH